MVVLKKKTSYLDVYIKIQISTSYTNSPYNKKWLHIRKTARSIVKSNVVTKATPAMFEQAGERLT